MDQDVGLHKNQFFELASEILLNQQFHPNDRRHPPDYGETSQHI